MDILAQSIREEERERERERPRTKTAAVIPPCLLDLQGLPLQSIDAFSPIKAGMDSPLRFIFVFSTLSAILLVLSSVSLSVLSN